MCKNSLYYVSVPQLKSTCCAFRKPALCDVTEGTDTPPGLVTASKARSGRRPSVVLSVISFVLAGCRVNREFLEVFFYSG